jgi:hypothetical protein
MNESDFDRIQVNFQIAVQNTSKRYLEQKLADLNLKTNKAIII